MMRNGNTSANARTAGTDPGPLRQITADGSTAATGRSRGSYEPVPAPTLTTGDTSPSAARSPPAIRRYSRVTTGIVITDPVMDGQFGSGHGATPAQARGSRNPALPG